MKTTAITAKIVVMTLACLLLATCACGCSKDEPAVDSGSNERPSAASGEIPESAGSSTGGAQAEAPIDEPPPPSPMPDIALEINSAGELTIYQGTPLIVTVRLANQRAANVASRNEVEAPPERRRPVPVVTLPSGWQQAIRIDISSGGSSRKLSWPLRAMGGQSGEAAELDGTSVIELQWTLSPEDSVAIHPGSYSLAAILEVTASDRGWCGTVTSEPVMLQIEAPGADLKPQEALEPNLELARYHALLKDWPKSLSAAREAVAKNPDSIDGHALLGDALAESGQLEAALSAYEAAVLAFGKQSQNEQRPLPPPRYMVRRIRQVVDRIRRLESP